MKDRITALRKDLGMSQAKFAEELSMTRTYISLVENGERNLSARSINDICRLYGVNKDWLENGTGEMYAPKSREKELADMAYQIMHEEDDFRKKLVETMLKLDEKQLEFLRNLANRLADEK